MPDEVRERFELYGRLGQHCYRVAEARALISRALDACDQWYVAFSGGKDSTCVLALVREQSPGTVAACSVPEFCLPETTDYLSRVQNLIQVASGSDHGTEWAVNWAGPEDVPEHIRWIGRAGETLPNYGLASKPNVFLGLREEESSARRAHLRSQGALFFSKKGQGWHCSPLAHWTIDDVWAYILEMGLDYNRAYDRMSEIGVPLERQRIGPFAVDKVLGYGPLAILKRGWPDVFNAYAARHLEARGFV